MTATRAPRSFPPPAEPLPARGGRGGIVALDIVRGGAALYVALYHSIDVLTATGRQFHRRRGPISLIADGNLLGLAGFGLYAVLVFFVLSGFVVHFRQAERPGERRAMGRGRWLAGYGWRRFMRIYPPLVGAILATALLWTIGLRAFPDLYGHLIDHPTAAHLVDQPGTWRAAFLTLVPYKGPAGFGADVALWSISFEVWFYLAYVPLLLLLRDRLRITFGALLAGSLLVSAALYLAFPRPSPLMYIAIYFPAWLGGAYLAEIRGRGVRLSRRAPLAVLGVLTMSAAAAVSGNNLDPPVDLLWCAGIAFVLAAVALGRRERPPSRAANAAAVPARWSYSLYLIHLPVIVFVYGLLHDGTGPVSSPITVALVFLSTIAAALVLYVLVERPSLWVVHRARLLAPR